MRSGRVNCEMDRYRRIVAESGEVAARAWMADLVRTYRKVVVERRILTLKRRELICGYVCAKRILSGRDS